MKFHVKENGDLGKCSAASEESCPFTKEGAEHFNDFKSASNFSEKIFEKELGMFNTVTKVENADDFKKMAEYNKSIMKNTNKVNEEAVEKITDKIMQYINNAIDDGKTNCELTLQGSNKSDILNVETVDKIFDNFNDDFLIIFKQVSLKNTEKYPSDVYINERTFHLHWGDENKKKIIKKSRPSIFLNDDEYNSDFYTNQKTSNRELKKFFQSREE